jgi:phospholipid/cholesterol/gamma-HCH transport system ATP-binding protein
MVTAISLNKLNKQYDGRPVIQNVSLSVETARILAIVGPSGCGKSTLLRMISGLETPDSGQVTLADDNLTLVFQYSALFDSLTVFENVAFSYLEEPDERPKKPRGKRKKMPLKDLRLMVHEKLELVGLGDVLDLYPNQLSGGMQKRVSFARAIMSDPAIILYDEPTAGLDPIATTLIEDYIVKVRQETQATSIVVTHHLSTIRRVADDVCLIFEGKIQWVGSAQDFFTSSNPYVEQFVNASLTGPMLTHVD